MAIWRSSSRCSSCCFFLFLLLNAAAVIHGAAATGETYSLAKSCPSIDACRGGVANLRCCKAINDAITQGECSCVCRQLKIYNHGHLAQDCSGKWCVRCGICRCANGLDEADIYISKQ